MPTPPPRDNDVEIFTESPRPNYPLLFFCVCLGLFLTLLTRNFT